MSRSLRPRGTVPSGPNVAFGRVVGDKRFSGTQNSGVSVPKKKRTAFGDRTNELNDGKPDLSQPFKKSFKPSASTTTLPPAGLKGARPPLPKNAKGKPSHRSHNVLPSVHKTTSKQQQPTPAQRTTTTSASNVHSVSDQLSLDVISLSSASQKSDSSSNKSDEFSYTSRLEEDNFLVISTDMSTTSSKDITGSRCSNQAVPAASSSTTSTVSSSVTSSVMDEDFEMIDADSLPEMKECSVELKKSLEADEAAEERRMIEKFHEVDTENIGDQIQVADYAYDIFEYYKEREATFKICDYLPNQKHIKEFMRSVLVDWLVEVQENFELNHETLYMAVKIIDLYLSKKQATKDRLQLIGATAMFIASKFDERMPPLIEDFTFICDDAYTSHSFILCEMEILKTIDFDLGFPLSYRFLRRWSKISRDAMDMLTLARYVLESSLMGYQFSLESESKMAAATLFLAHCMKRSSTTTPDQLWTPVLEYHSGYKTCELQPLAQRLNKMLRQQQARKQENLQTVFSKYSHEVFHKVAQIPLISDDAIPSS